MSHHHERQLCRCGAVIRQCRCVEPKTDRVITPWCDRCRPLDGTTSRPAAVTPPTLSRREKIELLARENPIVGHALGMHRFHAVPWTEALEEMVLYLADADAKKMELLIEAARCAPPPPIVIECRTECLLKKVVVQ